MATEGGRQTVVGLKLRRVGAALLLAAGALLGVWSCAGAQLADAAVSGIASGHTEGSAHAASADTAMSADTGTTVAIPADTAGTGDPSAVGNQSNALGQAVLVLPFRDASKYRGPWDIYTGLPIVVADSLVRNEFLTPVGLEGILSRLVGEERQGVITPSRAVGLGRVAGADWVVMGEIEDLTMKRFQATVPLGGYRRYEGWAAATVVAYRVIDGQRVGEHRAETLIDDRRTGVVNPATHVPLDRQYLLLDLMKWGSPEFWNTLVGQAVRQCAGDLAAGLSQIIRPPPELAVSEPKIIDVDGDRAYINVGLVEAIQNGDKFGVWDLGRELRDPDTGTVLGQALPRRVAVVQVEQVLSDHLSQVRILDGQEQVRKYYAVRAE